MDTSTYRVTLQTSSSSQGFVDNNIKVVLEFRLCILKWNFCFHFTRAQGATGIFSFLANISPSELPLIPQKICFLAPNIMAHSSGSPRVAVVELGVDGLDVDDGGVEARPVVEEQVGRRDARGGGTVRHYAQQVLHQVLFHRHQRLSDLI